MDPGCEDRIFHCDRLLLQPADTQAVEIVGYSPDSSNVFHLLRPRDMEEVDHIPLIHVLCGLPDTLVVRPLRPAPFLAFVLLAFRE